MQSPDSGIDRVSLLRDLELSSTDSDSSDEQKSPPRSLNAPKPVPASRTTKRKLTSGHRDIVRTKIERTEQRFTDAIVKAKRDQKARAKQREKRNKQRRADAKIVSQTIAAAREMWCVLNEIDRPRDAPREAPVAVAFIRNNWKDLERIQAEYEAKQTAPLSRVEKFVKKFQK